MVPIGGEPTTSATTTTTTAAKIKDGTKKHTGGIDTFLEIFVRRFSNVRNRRRSQHGSSQQQKQDKSKKQEMLLVGTPLSELECPLCLIQYDENNNDSVYVLAECHHSFCVECLQRYLKQEIMESRVALKCPQCPEDMHPNDVYTLITRHAKSKRVHLFVWWARAGGGGY